ncbi:MAG: UDP-N-acetylglucosamine 2-epimerase (non-hydrolyzing) [Nitrospinae bacterium]|nr:UDP-N-acetylglucosamine 2-epimerase (non-hydrolyzing) [Nitrospinota bacterium]MBI3813119.1 UDP-N-acetylglucosamine 2-epimerase (non-hydrolyzing) [Nitrospinota bacterium]
MKVLCVFGTRPEAIKFISVIHALRAQGNKPIICTTSQHRQMLDQVLATFDIKPDIDLDIMQPNQNLFDITSNVLKGIDGVLQDVQPDWVLVQGDATTTFAASLAAYYSRIRIGHIEAGLRTGNKYAPFPEELNRRATTVFADAHFAPTLWARENLLRENIPSDHIWVTGNTSIDALHLTISKIENDVIIREAMKKQFSFLSTDRTMILVTAHRRENFGTAFEDICLSLREIAITHTDVQIVYPVHLNPNVREPVERILGWIVAAGDRGKISMVKPLPNLFLIEPLDYISLVYLLKRAFLVITDSGGIQEEAPSLGKPVLVMRDVTERPEAIEAGVARLVGTSRTTIVPQVFKLLNDPVEYKRMAKPTTVYGDGHAAERIVKALLELGR